MASQFDSCMCIVAPLLVLILFYEETYHMLCNVCRLFLALTRHEVLTKCMGNLQTECLVSAFGPSHLIKP